MKDRRNDINMDLFGCVVYHNIELARQLLNDGINVNAREDNLFGYTALMSAVLVYGNLEMVRLLLNYGADVNAKSKSNKRILDYTETIRYPNIYNYIKLHKRIKGI